MSFLKLVYQNKNELPGKSMALRMMVSRFEKSHRMSAKILSSFALTAQPHQNIVNRSDTDKRAYSHPSPPPPSILLAYYGHGISNMMYMPQIFHFPD